MWRRDGKRYLFVDRADAGAKLANALTEVATPGALVLGIPRGGVLVAAAVARALQLPLDAVVARKLGAPDQPELAIGAVTADGGRYLDEAMVRELNVTPQYLAAVTTAEQAEARRRERRYRGDRPPPALAGRDVLLVDDGLATGATMRAAARALRARQPAKIVIAAPVGSSPTVAALASEADIVVCLHTPEPFYAVGAFYERFEPVSDDDVARSLAEQRPV
jgi:predicted phosphoribosyltransferase